MFAGIFDNPLVRIAVSVLIFVVLFPILVSFLPVIPFPTGIADAIRFIVGFVWQWNFLLPVELLFFALFIWVLMETSFIMIYIGVAIWRMKLKSK